MEERYSRMKKKLGVIFGNRGFFPDHLCQSARGVIIGLIESLGLEVVVLSESERKYGSVETRRDAMRCADLFKRNADSIIGVLITLPNFGDERGVAETLKMAGLNVPVLVHAFPDDRNLMTINDRRDSFCGKLSVCNNLVQFRIPFTLTSKHVMDPSSPDFRQDLVNFIATCNVISGLNGARFGAVGARPAAFNTVRFSEKLLAASNILVDTVDLFDVFGKVDKIGDSDELVQARLAAIKEYVSCEGIPDAALLKMATFGVILEKMREENGWTGTAVQCWTAIEEFFGVVPCSVMSEESQGLNESACEVDIMGLISQTSLRLASGRPAALVDFNNGFADDDDLCVVFHCSNLPKCMFCSCRMDYQEIIAGTVGKENTYGTVVGKIANGPFTFARLTTNDVGGCITGYVGQGEMVDTGVQTFGGFGEARIQNMQKLLRHLCLEGYEHHVAITQAGVAAAVAEAWRYLGWQTYQHE